MVTMWLLFAVLLAVVAAIAVYRLARRKNIDIILRAAITRRHEHYQGTRHVFFFIADHYEPLWRTTDAALGLERVKQWHESYPKLVDKLRDNGGRPPRHGFFFPEEEYAPSCLDLLSDIERRGFGEVEVHLHHDNDTAESLREKLSAFRDTLHHQHGLLHVDPATGGPAYAFIHGNWALHDSGARGRDCGVSNELAVLQETGCYADFTFPSAPHATQPPVINRIYYPAGDPNRPKSHHRARDAAYGVDSGSELLMVTGPLAINWAQRRRGFLPAVENGDITHLNPASPDRVDAWVNTGVCVRGWPQWVFVKAYTHGAQERNAQLLLSDRGADLYRYLLSHYNDGHRYVLHFTTPWEVYRCVKALESRDREAIHRIETFDYAF